MRIPDEWKIDGIKKSTPSIFGGQHFQLLIYLASPFNLTSEPILSSGPHTCLVIGDRKSGRRDCLHTQVKSVASDMCSVLSLGSRVTSSFWLDFYSFRTESSKSVKSPYSLSRQKSRWWTRMQIARAAAGQPPTADEGVWQGHTFLWDPRRHQGWLRSPSSLGTALLPCSRYWVSWACPENMLEAARGGGIGYAENFPPFGFYLTNWKLFTWTWPDISLKGSLDQHRHCAELEFQRSSK